MNVKTILFGHYVYSLDVHSHIEKLINERLLKLELAGYTVIRQHCADNRVYVQILGSTELGHDPDILEQFFHTPHNHPGLPGTSFYLISGGLYHFGGFKITTLTSLQNVSTPKELSAHILTVVDNVAHYDEEVPAMYVALVIRELQNRIHDFLTHLPKKAIARRVYLASFIRDLLKWHASLNDKYSKRYVVRSAIDEQLKNVWGHKEISNMRSDFKADVYVDSRLHIDWYKVYNLQLTHLTALTTKVQGVWDPVAQCRSI